MIEAGGDRDRRRHGGRAHHRRQRHERRQRRQCRGCQRAAAGGPAGRRRPAPSSGTVRGAVESGSRAPRIRARSDRDTLVDRGPSASPSCDAGRGCAICTSTRLPPLAADEWVLDTPRLRAFVALTRELIAAAPSPPAACEALREPFAGLLADRDWLPGEYRRPVPESGMGGGIGQWLLFRAADRSLSLFSLVVPPGSSTPIHDHLAWGLVGLYAGSQDEEFYEPGNGTIACTRRRPLSPGEHYVLMPPRDDVHRVRTTSPETSVSIHLLASDAGCITRHTFDDRSGASSAFVSGYANAECEPGR